MDKRGKKRATMMVESDDEDEDLFSEKHEAKPIKKPKTSGISSLDLASGPQDFIDALTQAGFYPRTENLPNVLSMINDDNFYIFECLIIQYYLLFVHFNNGNVGVHQSDFQQQLRDHFFSSIHYPRNIEFFVNECDQFFNVEGNFIKALQPTEVSEYLL